MTFLMRTAQDILAELNAADESPRVEAKRSRDIGKSVIETVVAFATEAAALTERIFSSSHPIYAQFFDLQGLDMVRIIEGRK